MTATVATTLLKVGACLELTQRFALEYIIKTNQQDVSLIFTGKHGAPQDDNHLFIIIGKIKSPGTL